MIIVKMELKGRGGALGNLVNLIDTPISHPPKRKPKHIVNGNDWIQETV